MDAHLYIIKKWVVDYLAENKYELLIIVNINMTIRPNKGIYEVWLYYTAD